MIIAVSLLAISLSILIYHHPPSTWRTRLQGDLASKTAPRAQSNAEQDVRRDNLSVELERAGEKEWQEDDESTASAQSTPKATPSDHNGVAVPTFTLAEHENEDGEDTDEEDNMPPPSFPAMNSAQRASAPSAPSLMAPPSQPRAIPPPSLMPPPQLKVANLRALPTTPVQGLRVPTTGPLPNRGPVPSRTPGSGLGPPLTTGRVPPTPNARGKILLAPGHSPLDWAKLQRSGENLSGVSALLRVTPSMLKYNNGRKGKPAWSSYQGKVYNITPYLPFHPGGEGELRRAAGKDGGKLFMEVHPWVNWENMLGECVVGIAVSEEEPPALSHRTGSLEDMD